VEFKAKTIEEQIEEQVALVDAMRQGTHEAQQVSREARQSAQELRDALQALHGATMRLTRASRWVTRAELMRWSAPVLVALALFAALSWTRPGWTLTEAQRLDLHAGRRLLQVWEQASPEQREAINAATRWPSEWTATSSSTTKRSASASKSPGRNK
jgi:hypothetical protein